VHNNGFLILHVIVIFMILEIMHRIHDNKFLHRLINTTGLLYCIILDTPHTEQGNIKPHFMKVLQQTLA